MSTSEARGPTALSFDLPEHLVRLREDVAALCARFPDTYWRDLQPHGFPVEFVDELTRAGYLAALIPEEYGGSGLGLTAASVILEEVNHSGGSAAACHAQMYVMGILLRHGSEEQRRRYLPRIASGELRLQAFSVTEREVGSDTTNIQTTAYRSNGGYVVNGHKGWTSRALYSDLLLLLARTTPLEKVQRKGEGLSVFLIDLREVTDGVHIAATETMVNHHTSEVFFEGAEIPADSLIGEEGQGFRYVLTGLNAERILIAAECVGDGRWFVERAARYGSERHVFGRPIASNQGVQFPIARAHLAVEAADLMRYKAASLFERELPCGAEANSAKLLASEASWQAANACLDTHGGNGFRRDHDVERKFRETRVYTVAPVANNLVLAYVGQRVLGMPRSY
jgi:acyl-CoA dehydrogenase